MNLNKKIKAMMFDVDGTLINRDCIMTDAMYKSLIELKKRGYSLAINSGRPIVAGLKVLNNNQNVGDLFDYYFCCNGAEVLDYKANKISYYGRIGLEEMKKLDLYFKDDDDMSLAYYSEDSTKIYTNKQIKDEELRNIHEKPRMGKIVPIDFQNNSYSPSKCIILFRPGCKEKVENIISKIDDVDLKFMCSGIDCFEVTRNDIDKGKSVLNYAAILKIDKDEILCFGDEQSDMPALLTGVGCMVGDKIDGAKYRCKDVKSDGISEFLKEHCFI